MGALQIINRVADDPPDQGDEPDKDDDRWITQRLYGGASEDRLAQEIVLGVGGVRLLHAIGEPVDAFHFNEGHAVFAGLELLRQHRYGGTSFSERIDNLRQHVVFTTHTPVPAGNEVHELDLMRKMDADLGVSNDWVYNIVKAVGNYGEIFDRNIGAGSPLKIARGINAQWTKGGLQYALPIR